MEYTKIGKIINTHGIKGDLKLELYTDFVEERFKEDSLIYIGDKYIPETVKEYRMHQGHLLLRLKDKENINLVLEYKNMDVYKSKDDIKPLKNGYYVSDLNGLEVYADDKLIGIVRNVEEGVSYNYIRVKTDEKEVLIPFIENVFIKKVDLDKRRIDINVIEGLL